MIVISTGPQSEAQRASSAARLRASFRAARRPTKMLPVFAPVLPFMRPPQVVRAPALPKISDRPVCNARAMKSVWKGLSGG